MPKHPCPKCGQSIRFPDAGLRRVRCPACKHIFMYEGTAPPPLPTDHDSSSSSGNPLFARPDLLILLGGGIGIILILLVAILATMLIGGGDQRDAGDQAEAALVNGESKPLRPVAVADSPQLSPEQLFAKISPAVVRVVMRDKELTEVGQGSGFFVSSDGLVITNHHVIDNGDYANVLLSNNAKYLMADIVAVDEDHDLALLKVNGDGLAPNPSVCH